MTATIATEPHLSKTSLDERLATACGQLNACYAHLVELLGEAIASGSWQGYGIRSVEQWIGWRTGLAPGHCRTLAALVAALIRIPRWSRRSVRGSCRSIKPALPCRPAPNTMAISPCGRRR